MSYETHMREVAGPTAKEDGTHGSRSEQIKQLLARLEADAGMATAGQYRALVALLTDATLAGDEGSLLIAQDGLQRVRGIQLNKDAPTPEESEQRGRVMAALDAVTWTLRRLTPSSAIARLEPGSHAHRFLEVVHVHPGITSGAIEDLLELRSDVVSRIGRRLLAHELVSQLRAGRHKHWDITPRGRQALAALTHADVAPVNSQSLRTA